MRPGFLFLLILVPAFSIAQQSDADSLSRAVSTLPDDTNKVIALSDLAMARAGNKQFDLARASAQQGIDLAKKLNYDRGVGKCYLTMSITYSWDYKYKEALQSAEQALVYSTKANDKKGISWAHDKISLSGYRMGDHIKALKHGLLALELRRELKDTAKIAMSCQTIGIIYQEQGDYANAIRYMKESLSLNKILGDSVGMATDFLNIGISYATEGSDSIAFEYYSKAIALYRSMGDRSRMASVMINYGNLYTGRGEYDLAMKHFRDALEIYSATGNESRKGLCMQNIGNLFMKKDQPDSALWYYRESYRIHKAAGDVRYTGAALISIAGVLYERKNYDEAAESATEGLRYVRAANARVEIASACLLLSQIHASQNNYRVAYDYHLAYAAVHDSLFNEESAEALNLIRTQYETEKKDNQIRMLNDSTALQKATIERQIAQSGRDALLRNSLIAGFILVAGLAFFIFRGYRQKQKANEVITHQKLEVEKQKEIIEEKNKDILDSITYAKRLQEAILPQINHIAERLPGSYVVYKPKDIVAGDFYFMEMVNGKTIVAAADCTGHGVPGAMVSVVCSNALSRAVKEFMLTDPGKILDKVRELVMETFAKSGSEVQDGMDISLAVIDDVSGKVSWAGANNPLWYYSNGQMHEIAADKQPVGKTDHAKNFTTHEVNLQKGGRLYLFTDGYADQFGGPQGKKFKYKPMKEMLSSIASMSAKEQEYRVSELFNEWKGKLEQVDDVCILAILV